MVFSFAVAILIASRSISRGLAFAIFVGSTSLHGAVAVAFTSGLHAAFYASMGFMALAAALSALRAGSYPETRVERGWRNRAAGPSGRAIRSRTTCPATSPASASDSLR